MGTNGCFVGNSAGTWGGPGAGEIVWREKDGVGICKQLTQKGRMNQDRPAYASKDYAWDLNHSSTQVFEGPQRALWDFNLLEHPRNEESKT